MILIADSGSTKTSWSLLKNKEATKSCNTGGINPFFLNEEEIHKILANEYTLDVKGIREIYFYGAGCALPEKKQILRNALKSFFKIDAIHVESDLLGAARSLCGTESGIACILGTGSNSCYYNGKEIELNISPLGYILGDEGSGAVLGKKLVADILKRQLPDVIIKDFFETYSITPAEILENVYRKTFPNRFLAQFTRFIASHIENESIERIVSSSFEDFFIRNVYQYPQCKTNPVNFTGSIASVFHHVLERVAGRLDIRIGVVSQNPMRGLLEYHSIQKQ